MESTDSFPDSEPTIENFRLEYECEFEYEYGF